MCKINVILMTKIKLIRMTMVKVLAGEEGLALMCYDDEGNGLLQKNSKKSRANVT